MTTNSDCLSIQYLASLANTGVNVIKDLLEFTDQHEHLLDNDLGAKKVYNLSLRFQTLTAELNLLTHQANELTETLSECHCKKCLGKKVCSFRTAYIVSI
jgi:hypothetical protein